MASVRLPGKVMAEIEGKPVVWHIVNRLRCSKVIDNVIVATSVNESDEPIRSFVRENDMPSYAGSERDLVDRFYQASKIFGIDVIVRITADCPLVDPQVVDKVISVYMENTVRYDYVSNCRPQATYPQGFEVEVFGVTLLQKLWHEIEDPFRREWFTTVVFENPREFKLHCVKNEVDLSGVRLTLDYPEDLEVVRFVYHSLYNGKNCFYLADILSLLEKSPRVLDINKKYRRDEAYREELKKRGLA